MRTLFLLAWLIGIAPAAVAAQTVGRAEGSRAEVVATVQRLFDGMRAGDSTAVRSVFHPEARLLTTVERGGVPVLQSGSVDQFVAAVGGRRDAVWDERISEPEIRVEGNLATAWMEYDFYLGDRVSHCGVNALQLFRAVDGWRIVQIMDTRRREGCGTER